MAIKRIAKNDPLTVENILMLIYGEPGTGKSSLSFTADMPYCLDFDKGLQRAVKRGDAVQFDDWNDATEFVDGNDIKDMGIKTIICDTGGTMLDDYITNHIIKIGGKGITNAFGGLGLPGYGVLKDQFTRFYLKCKEYKIDIIFVCHVKTQDNDGKYVPKMTGGSAEILVSKADLIGYIEMAGNKITLDFNPTDRHAGKNCAGFKRFEIPHYEDPSYDTFLSKVIAQTKLHMNRMSQAQIDAVKKIEEFGDRILACDTIDDLVVISTDADNLPAAHKLQVNSRINKRHAELWAITNIDVEALKKPEDFAAISEKTKLLPAGVRGELSEGMKKLMDAANVEFDKETKAFKFKAAAPAKEEKKRDTVVKEKKTPDPETKINQPIKSDTPPPVEESKKTTIKVKKGERITRDEEWFKARIGKQVIQKDAKGIAETTIANENSAFHMANVMQKKFEYFDVNEDPFPTNPTPANASEPVEA